VLRVADDYPPVVEEGELEASSSFLGRLRRREELTPVSPGFRRVLLDAEGSPFTSAEQFTPGEKRNTTARRWARVDVRHHRLEYRVGFSDASGSANYVADVAVDASVVDAVRMLEYGAATSVKDILAPAINRAIAGAARTEASKRDGNDAATLAHMRQQVADGLRNLENRRLDGVPEWLSATIQTVQVDFNKGTREHYDELTKLEQRLQLTDVRQRNEQKETEGKIKVRDLWRKDLLPNLSNSSLRTFEEVYANPTDANIRAAVRQANERELLILREVLGTFENMAKDGFYEKDDPTVRALAGLVSRLPQLFPGTDPMLKEGDRGAIVDTSSEPPEARPGDRDFSD
jgi:hypothetical protein